MQQATRNRNLKKQSLCRLLCLSAGASTRLALHHLLPQWLPALQMIGWVPASTLVALKHFKAAKAQCEEQATFGFHLVISLF